MTTFETQTRPKREQRASCFLLENCVQDVAIAIQVTSKQSHLQGYLHESKHSYIHPSHPHLSRHPLAARTTPLV